MSKKRIICYLLAATLVGTYGHTKEVDVLSNIQSLTQPTLNPTQDITRFVEEVKADSQVKYLKGLVKKVNRKLLLNKTGRLTTKVLSLVAPVAIIVGGNVLLPGPGQLIAPPLAALSTKTLLTLHKILSKEKHLKRCLLGWTKQLYYNQVNSIVLKKLEDHPEWETSYRSIIEELGRQHVLLK
jgi:hypothetical protein